MRLKDIDRAVRSAKLHKKVLVLNFSEKELDYADPRWRVINLGK